MREFTHIGLKYSNGPGYLFIAFSGDSVGKPWDDYWDGLISNLIELEFDDNGGAALVFFTEDEFAAQDKFL